jgi:formylmethanofuran dehydrogenase subunit C
MPLQLQKHAKLDLPINAESIRPERVRGLNESAIGNLPIYQGNEKVTVSDLFAINGSADEDDTVHFSGDLRSVNRIGSTLESGTILIDGNVGRHVGSYMSGGKIVVRGDADDFLGMAMTGGEIHVTGNAANHVGANYSGAPIGMNRGTILISGNVGSGCGQFMRRGTIVVGGDAGDMAGWNMIAGTLIVLGDVGAECGTNMKRGTIILGTQTADSFSTFARGEQGSPVVVKMLAKWLERQRCELIGDRLGVLQKKFQHFHGDLLTGGRGEIFVRCED